MPSFSEAMPPLLLSSLPLLVRRPRTGTPPTMPCFRLINDMGEACPGAELPDMDRETAMAIQVPRSASAFAACGVLLRREARSCSADRSPW